MPLHSTEICAPRPGDRFNEAVLAHRHRSKPLPQLAYRLMIVAVDREGVDTEFGHLWRPCVEAHPVHGTVVW